MKIKMTCKSITLPALLFVALVSQAAAASQSSIDASDTVFARINDTTITQSQFQSIFEAAIRHKYYHGKVPSSELEQFRKQVASDIVDQILVHAEALRLGLQPDRQRISEGIAAFQSRNAGNPDWERKQADIVPRLRERMERQDLIEKMETRIRDIPAPSKAEIRQFYLDNPEKFTEPGRLRVAVILLKVAPASPESTWLEVERRMDDIRQRIVQGEDFSTIARETSQHPSSTNGGDLGLLHRGVLEDNVQRVVEPLEIGGVSPPIRLLEGLALFQLLEVLPAQLKRFGEVRERAAGLLYRENQDLTWERYVEALKASANVYLSEH